VLGTILVNSIWCTLSPVSEPSLGVATAGVPISAPRPLPKPERAIAPEATGTEFSTQTAKRRGAPESLHPESLRRKLVPQLWGAPHGALVKKLKKVLTLGTKIVYHGGRFQNR
jgi:hypothetical protein